MWYDSNCFNIISVFFLMIFKGTEGVMRTFYFNSLYFESMGHLNEGITINFGISNYMPIVITTVCIFIVILTVEKLKNRKVLEG